MFRKPIPCVIEHSDNARCTLVPLSNLSVVLPTTLLTRVYPVHEVPYLLSLEDILPMDGSFRSLCIRLNLIGDCSLAGLQQDSPQREESRKPHLTQIAN